MEKYWYLKQIKGLSPQARIAKKYSLRICKLLTVLSGREFHVIVDKWNSKCEAHLIDSGKCKAISKNEYILTNDADGEPIDMIFWGGHFSCKKHKDALSKVWLSFLEDCIGLYKYAECHNLTDHLKDFGPIVDLNCKSLSELEVKLAIHGV